MRVHRFNPVLKRPDERYITMQAFDNPAFVEDIVRGVGRGPSRRKACSSV